MGSALRRILPGFDFDGFMGLAGPAALPSDIIVRLNREVNAAVNDPKVRARILESGLELGGGKPDQLATAMKAQAETMIRLAKSAGIKPVD